MLTYDSLTNPTHHSMPYSISQFHHFILYSRLRIRTPSNTRSAENRGRPGVIHHMSIHKVDLGGGGEREEGSTGFRGGSFGSYEPPSSNEIQANWIANLLVLPAKAISKRTVLHCSPTGATYRSHSIRIRTLISQPYADNQLLCSPQRSHTFNSAGFKYNN